MDIFSVLNKGENMKEIDWGIILLALQLAFMLIINSQSETNNITLDPPISIIQPSFLKTEN